MKTFSLAERQAVLPDRWLAGELPTAAAEEAVELLEWWSETYLLGSKRLMTRRLGALGLDRHTVPPLLAASGLRSDDDRRPTTDDRPPADDGIATVVGGRSSVVPYSAIHRWQSVLAEVLAAPAPGEVRASEACASPGFDVAFRPFLRWARARLEERLAALQDAHPDLGLDGAALADQFADALRSRLNGQAIRTFVLRLHAAKLLGRLRAETSGERFQEFVRAELADPDGFAALLVDYPVLGRVLATTAERSVATWTEALRRLVADWEAIGRAFDLPETRETLVALEPGLGDAHRGGRAVMKLRFASGRRLVYKPKPLAVDVHFQALLAWLNDRGLEPPLRTLAVLDRGDYGWMEFVEPGACTERAQVEAFYRRQGALLLVLYLLDATDFHLENIIAAGEHPVPIDLEMLFHNQPRPPRGSPTAEVAAENVFSRLVLRIGLLPHRLLGPAGSMELSGLAGEGGQTVAFPRLRWVDENTDEMRAVMQQIPLPAAENLPRLGDQPAPVIDYGDALIQGFADAYRLVLAYGEELGAPDGPLQAFRHDRVRHILRATREYAALLTESTHPSCLRDATERDFLFDTLWLDVTAFPYLARVVRSEHEDLWEGDIPLFTARVGGRDLFDSRGRRVPGFFATSGLDRVLDRLAHLGEEDLGRQLYCVRGSLATLTGGSGTAVPARGTEVSRTAATPAALLAAATRIGDRLTQLAVLDSGEAHWVGPKSLPDGRFTFDLLGTDLYSGTAGIALFLAYLARATGRASFDDLARAAYGGVRRQLRSRDPGTEIGAFTGVPSMLYAALHLAHLWGEPDTLAGVLGAMRAIQRRVRRDSNFDIVSGSAGCIAVMLLLHRRHPDSAALEIARCCGEHLLHNAVEVSPGKAWPQPWASAQPLLGFSHGAAGIAWALFELAAALGETHYRAAACDALAYERSRFDPERGNWPDLRDGVRLQRSDASPAFMWAWCHGAPGIGLARLLSRRHTDDPQMAVEIAAALHSTTQHGFGRSHCLCHGDLGNAEFLLMAAQALNEPQWRHHALCRAQAVLDAEAREGWNTPFGAKTAPNGGPYPSNRWRCGEPGLGEIPGLMVGLAGIGYGLLRLADPEGVPSVLALEGPAEAAGRSA